MAAKATAATRRRPQHKSILLRTVLNKVTFAAYVLDKQCDQLVSAKEEGEVGEHVAEHKSLGHEHRQEGGHGDYLERVYR